MRRKSGHRVDLFGQDKLEDLALHGDAHVCRVHIEIDHGGVEVPVARNVENKVLDHGQKGSGKKQ